MRPSELDRARRHCEEGEALLASGDLAGAGRAFRAVLAGVGPLEDGTAEAGGGPTEDAGDGAVTADGTTTGAGADAGDGATGDVVAVAADGASHPDGATHGPDSDPGPDASPDRLAARAHVGLGRLLLDAGEPGRAEKEFRRAARLRPVDRDPLYWLGCSAAHQAAHHQGAYELAELRFTEVVERWAGDGPGLVQRAYVRVRLGRPADALADLRSAERAGALDAEARWVLAALSGATARDVARRLGAAARSAMGRGGATGPEGRSRAAGDWSRAVALLDRARQLDPGEREFALPHAVALCLSGRREDGLAVLANASRSAPTDRHLAHTMAVMAWHALTPTGGTGGAAGTGTGGAVGAGSTGDASSATTPGGRPSGGRAHGTAEVGVRPGAGATGNASNPTTPGGSPGGADANGTAGVGGSVGTSGAAEFDRTADLPGTGSASGVHEAGRTADASGTPGGRDAYGNGGTAGSDHTVGAPGADATNSASQPDHRPGEADTTSTAGSSLTASPSDAAQPGHTTGAPAASATHSATQPDSAPNAVGTATAARQSRPAEPGATGDTTGGSDGFGFTGGGVGVGSASRGTDAGRAGGGGFGDGGEGVARGWARCVALWGGLLHDAGFWERRRVEAAERYGVAVDEKALATLRADVQSGLEGLMPENDAGDQVSPEALLHREIEAARLLAEAGGLPLATSSVPLVCGPLRIVELGREPELGAFVGAAGDAAPALRQAFSHLGFGQALLRLDRPADALAALSGLRCPSCRARGGSKQPTGEQANGSSAHDQAPGHSAEPGPTRAGSSRPRRDRAAVCDRDCVHFDARNPAYAGQGDKHNLLMRDGRALALAARLAQGRAALTPAGPDVRRAAASWQKALVHARAIGQGAEVEGIVADTALGAAKALHRAGDIDAAGATLEAAYAQLGEGQHDRLKGQLARVLTDRGIAQANRDMDRLEGPAADLRRAVELNPHLHRAQANLGVVLRILGARMRWSGSLVGSRNRLQEALDRVTAALAHFPGDPELSQLRDLVEADLALVHSELEQGRIGGLPE
ncbi:hypothetical protein OHB14_21525 [Streptomyces sp. NBC_01613]|uniref:tetratricopeptide repeat protein n=1 Tax=Streptomyces sp. NBC_01613 TaxID=2975896 RepID=UPI003869C2F7